MMYKTYHFYVLLLALTCAASSLRAANLGNRNAVLYEFEEWSLNNGSFSGNAFDLVATVTFNHSSSSATHVTEMFYAGGNTWKFRFTPTKTGTWTFTTSSSDGDLNGHTGSVTASSNPDPKATGFVTSSGNKYAIQKGNDGELSGYLMNIFQGDPFRTAMLRLPFFRTNTTSKVRKYIEYAQDHGANSLTLILSVALNKVDANNISSAPQNPDIAAFDVLDIFMKEARDAGMHIHFWRWGDDARRMSSRQLPGGINGSSDKRVSRYIAARMGPLPSWSMGYGFDLHEWVNGSQLNSWQSFLSGKLGFPHLLSARSHRMSSSNQTITGYAQGDSELGQTIDEVPSYNQMKNKLDGDKNRAHLLEERNVLGRWGLRSDGTRKLMWNMAMAGGMGGWIGYFHKYGDGRAVEDPIWNNDNTGGAYSNASALKAHLQFWQDRFDITFGTANNLSSTSNVRVLKSSNNRRYVFYKENTSSFNANLSGMNGSQSAIAVDTKKAYAEVSLGTLSSSNQTISLPYSSDWVVAVGNFNTNTPPPPPTFSLTVNSGSGDGNYEAGTTVNISANTPPAGQIFDRWIGNVSGVANVNNASTTLTMPSSNITVTATYKVDNTPRFNLTVNNGSGDGSYTAGTVVNISANTPPSGKIFDRWTGNVSGVTNVNSASTTLTMPSSSVSVSATYKDIPIPTGTLVKVNFQPSNASTPSGYESDNGSAYGNRGNGFSYGWIGGGNGNTRNRSGSSDQRLRTLNHMQKGAGRTWEIAVPNGDYELEIGCGDPQYSDQVNNLDVEGVQVTDPDGEDNIDIFTSIVVTVSDGRLTIKPGNGSSNAKICYIDINILDGPPPVQYTLNVGNGSGDGNFTAGTVVNISAEAAPSGSEFDRWTGDVANVANVNNPNTTVTMPSSNITVTATYRDVTVPTFTLIVNNGSGDGSYEAGESVNIIADVAPSGQEFDRWTGNVANVGDVNSASTSITMPSSNTTVTATYKDLPPTGGCSSVDFEIEAEDSGNTLNGTARFNNKSAASGGIVVGYIGRNLNNYLEINNINVPCAGDYQVSVSYISGSTRTVRMRVNGGAEQSQSVNSGGWNNVSTFTKTFSFNEGDNTIRFFNGGAAPDIDKIQVTGQGNAREFFRVAEQRAFDIQVYPNPSTGHFSVSTKELKGHSAQLRISDAQGRLVKTMFMNEDIIHVNQKLTPGIYLLQLTTGSATITKRLIIQ